VARCGSGLSSNKMGLALGGFCNDWAAKLLQNCGLMAKFVACWGCFCNSLAAKLLQVGKIGAISEHGG